MLQPLITTLQAIDKGETFSIKNACLELSAAADYIRNLEANYDIDTARKNVTLSNRKLANRWHIVQPTYYDWVKRSKSRLYFLLLGAAHNVARTDYPLIAPEDFESVCNARGFDIIEILRVTGTSRNALKKWTRSEIGIRRAWDLIEGYSVHINK